MCVFEQSFYFVLGYRCFIKLTVFSSHILIVELHRFVETAHRGIVPHLYNVLIIEVHIIIDQFVGDAHLLYAQVFGDQAGECVPVLKSGDGIGKVVFYFLSVS